MLPDVKTIRKACRKHKIKTIPQENYFGLAEEFTQLTIEFTPDSLYEKAQLWIDMIVYPLYNLYTLLTSGVSLMACFSLFKCYQLWIRWLRFHEIKLKIRSWMHIVRSVGGPFISCNDAVYHMYVYADGMERVKAALASKKIRKTV
jgi:hypothetical protein